MALSFANIQTILRSRLSETSASAWTDAELQDYTYLAEHEIMQLMPADAFFDIQEVETVVEGGVGQGYVSLPSTALIQQLVNITISAGVLEGRVRIIEPDRTSEYAASTTDPVGWFEDGKLYFSPPLSGIVVHNVKFRFTPAPTEGAILLPDRFASLIVSYAYALAIDREDRGLADREKNEFYQRVAMLTEKNFGINMLGRSR